MVLKSQGRTLLHGFVFILLPCIVQICVSQESENGKTLITNLDVMRSLARAVTGRVLQESKIGDTPKLEITVLPKEKAWYIESGIVDYVKDAQFTVSEDGTAPYLIEFGLSDARVQYSNPRRDGFFGARIVDRKVDLRLTTKIVNRKTGLLTLSADFEETKTDTIETSDISRIENPVIPMTQAVLPREGFFSNFGEPIIVLGAIAIGVLLLFNVRS